MYSKKHIDAVKALIKRYESITQKEIKGAGQEVYGSKVVANKLTGFGGTDTCTLCRTALAADSSVVFCRNCIYAQGKQVVNACTLGEHYYTYGKITAAYTAKMLQSAFKARALYLRNLLKERGVK
uniref:Uncharacterized protein n=1 Tax=viral metagenome TaxID=1070528 RepID=A0A6M3LH62_9ZZZZ